MGLRVNTGAGMPTEVVYLIASFIDPNPYTFGRLATVCRSFNAAFSSDHIWRPLDVYELRSHIAQGFRARYMKLSEYEKQLLHFCWSPDSRGSVIPPPHNLDILLAAAVNGTDVLGCFQIDNYTVIEKAISINPGAFRKASFRLRACRQLALYAVSRSCYVLRYVSSDLLNDQELVSAAVKHDPWALELASSELKDVRSLVLDAVRRDGRALCFASPRLQDDPMIVLEAISQTGIALKFASPRLQREKELVVTAVAQDNWAYLSVTPELKHDADIVAAALTGEEPQWEIVRDIISQNSSGETVALNIYSILRNSIWSCPSWMVAKAHVGS